MQLPGIQQDVASTPIGPPASHAATPEVSSTTHSLFGKLVTGMLGALLAGSLQADVLLLDNGDRFTGTLLRLEGERLEFRQDTTATAFSVRWSQVAGLTTDDVVQVLLADGTEISGQVLAADPGHLRMATPSLEAPVIFPLESVTAITGPSTPPRDRVRTTGNIAAGGNLTRGNTRTTEYTASLSFEARSNVNRFRLASEVSQARDDGELSRDRTSTTARYDHFLSERVYANTNVAFSRDRFKDLRLRTAAGAGFGYQFFDTRRRSLSAELGASYVSQDFYEAENESNPAMRWALDFEERLMRGALRFFHDQAGLVSLERAEEFLVETRTGLRFPLFMGLTGTAHVNVDYDNDPPGNQSKTDQSYVLSVGYSW